jgi:hypothetical protein
MHLSELEFRDAPETQPAVLCQTVAEGAILLHTEHEHYFGLNAVGAQVWELLPPTCSDLAELCDEQAQERAFSRIS